MGNSISLEPTLELMPGNAAAVAPSTEQGRPPQCSYPESSPLLAKSTIVAGWTFGLNAVAGHAPPPFTAAAPQAATVALIAACAATGSKYFASPTRFVSTIRKL